MAPVKAGHSSAVTGRSAAGSVTPAVYRARGTLRDRVPRCHDAAVAGQRPVGWWVRRLDELLEQGLDDVVAAEGLTRRHWQVLESLAGGPVPRADLHAALGPFAAPEDVDAVLADLAGRGWAAGDAAPSLTPAGRAAHERLAAAVGAFRRGVADGLTAEEYAATVAGLARMVANLEGGAQLRR